MAQDKVKDSSDGKRQANDNYKSRGKKDKTFQSKVVVRRLPPTMTDEQFLDQISPVPDHDYFYYVKADMRLGQHAFSRAYLNFTQQDDIFLFKEKFDEYVFLDSKGNEYPAIVEFAPFQKIPKKRSKKRDAKCGTIDTDPDYLAFLENLKNPQESSLPTAEIYLEEIETRERELKANSGVLKMTTPLIEYLKQRKIEQQKIREEKREERKRKEMEKKRIREEERKRRKAEKDRLKEKFKEKESAAEKEIVEENEDADVASSESKSVDSVVQVLKNPEREKEQKEHVAPPLKSKSYFSWSNKEKERNRTDWDRDGDRQRDKLRQRDRIKTNEKQAAIRDKDRSRRERPEYKSHSNYKSAGKESKVIEHESRHKEQEKEKEIDASDVGIPSDLNKMKRDKSCPGNVESASSKDDLENNDDCSSKSCESKLEKIDDAKSEGTNESKEQGKDPRVDRRIKNKDRPSLEIYRPGMRRFSAQRNSPNKEISTSTSNSSTPSPSPTPPLITNSKIQVKDNEKFKNQKPPFSNDSSTKDNS